MKSMVMFAMLALVSIIGSGKADAQEYNLRTVPANPRSGEPIVVAFESTDCEAWVLPPVGQPPVVTVQGFNVRLEVDRINIENCSFQPRTHTLNIPALPFGSYQLELIARGFESPGNDIEAQTVSFQVAPAVGSGAISIPVNRPNALALLVAMVLLLGFAFRRRIPST